jgi:hypothetical protein
MRAMACAGGAPSGRRRVIANVATFATACNVDPALAREVPCNDDTDEQADERQRKADAQSRCQLQRDDARHAVPWRFVRCRHFTTLH